MQVNTTATHSTATLYWISNQIPARIDGQPISCRGASRPPYRPTSREPTMPASE